MNHLLTFMFLIVSAMGATIIVSKGDIFKPFRDFVDKLSIKNKLYVHDFTLYKYAKIFNIEVDGTNNEVDFIVSTESLHRFFKIHYDYLKMEMESQGIDSVRILVFLKSKRTINIQYNSNPNTFYGTIMANVYERTEKHKPITFISEMISCPQCAGVWIGMLWFVFYRMGLLGTGFNFSHPYEFIFKMLCTGCIVSLGAFLYFKILTLIDKI